MNIFKEIPPTAGFPLYLRDFLSLPAKKIRQGRLEEDFKSYLSLPYARLTCSGTAAFYLILEALKGVSNKKKVVIPSFVCPLLPLAIKRAGLDTVVCDINKGNFNFDIQQLRELCSKNGDILAIVAVHLGGIPLDFEDIRQVAKENGALVIEDCAQSLGAEYKGKKVGTLGELAFFSLCRGKGLTIYEGGIIAASRKEYAVGINNALERLVKDDFVSESIKILELFGYWIFYRPQLFWAVFKLPQIFWNWQNQPLRALTEYFTVDFPIHKVSRFRELIGRTVFPRLGREINKQRQKASEYIEKLRGAPGIKLITEAAGDFSTYPYLTLLFDDPSRRRHALIKLTNLGLGVSQIYASAITDYDYLKDITGNKTCPNGRYLSERQISLTTSAFLNNKGLAAVVETIKKL